MTGKQTFSVRTEGRRHTISDMVDQDDVVIISVDPVHTKTDAGETISVGFPVLIVSGWVSEPEVFAARVAALLTEHQP